MCWSALPRRALCLLFIAGCSFDEGGLSGDGDGGGSPDASRVDGQGGVDGSPADGGTDAPIDAGLGPDASCVGDPLGFDPSNFDRCDLVGPNAAVSFNSNGTWLLDTDAGTLGPPFGNVTSLMFSQRSQPGGPEITVIAFADLDIPAGVTLQLTGSRPVALVSLTGIDVAGTLSVGATGTVSGPGGDLDSLCSPVGRGAPGLIEHNAFEDEAGQGGGGGGYGGTGGAGGPVVTTQPAGGSATGNSVLVPLRGGCAGGAGESGGGVGGGAGGGLQLVAAGAITVSSGGRITARGGGGQGSTSAGRGGGGGGSGGALLLEASTITVAAGGALTANGGGGGEATRTGNNGDEGDDGHDGDGAQAAGGGGISTGGDGGPGGAELLLAGPGLIGSPVDGFPAGGGGGGGAVGRIHLRGISTVATPGVVSPDPQ